MGVQITKHRPEVYGFLLVILTVALFWRTADYGLVWDDSLHFQSRDSPVNNPTLENVGGMWQEPYNKLYVPVTYTIWSLVKTMGGGAGRADPTHFHILNILFHTVNVMLVFVLLRKLLKHDLSAVVGALLFSVHPVQVESVAWVSEFRGLISMFFALIAIWQYMVFSDRSYHGSKNYLVHYVVSTLAFVLALLSKPSAVVIPAIVFILDTMLLRNPAKRSVRSLSLWAFFSVVVMIVTMKIQSNEAMDFVTPFWARPLIVSDSINFYLSKVVFPLKLSAAYGRTPEAVMQHWWFYLTWLPPLVFLYALWKVRESWSAAQAAGLIFIVGFLPTSGIVPFAFQNWSTVADRYLYLSMLGPAMALAVYVKNRTPSRISTVLAIVLVVNWGVLTLAELPKWKNRVNFWTDVIQKAPNQPQPYNNRGVAYHVLGKNREALMDYGQALKIDSNFVDAYLNRGNLYHTLRMYEKALDDFNRVINADSGYVKAYVNKGNVYNSMGRHKDAVTSLSAAIELDSGYANAYNSRGVVLSGMGRFEEAIEDFNWALEVDPVFAEAYVNRGAALAKVGRYEEAIGDFTRAIEIRPNHATSYYNRMLTYGRIRQYDKARLDMEKLKMLEYPLDSNMVRELTE